MGKDFIGTDMVIRRALHATSSVCLLYSVYLLG